MVKSMTAYARREEKSSWGSVEIDLRSVNHRFLEMHVRLPDELRSIEMAIRECIKGRLKRGKVDLTIHLHMQLEEGAQIAFDHELAKQVAKTLHEIDKFIYNAASVNAIDILNWPGVLGTSASDTDDVIKETVLALLNTALDDLADGREREGEALKQMISERCTEMRKVIGLVRNNMPAILQAQKERLEERLSALKAEMDNDRLEQEMVFITYKADVDEEVDRLDTHLDEIERIMNGNEAIGRRLDFVMQELNREANTLGSKSISNITTQASVDMKVLIEQMREQIQNIE